MGAQAEDSAVPVHAGVAKLCNGMSLPLLRCGPCLHMVAEGTKLLTFLPSLTEPQAHPSCLLE